MSSAHDAALAFLMSQSTAESIQINRQAVTTKVTVSMSPKASKKLAVKNEPAPIRQKSEPMVGMMLPDRGTLGAKDFLLAMRNAGRRLNDSGVPFTNPAEVRNDQIRAIHAFMYEMRKDQKVHVGYDPTGSFGSQEVAARMLANRELLGAPKVSHIAPPSRTFGGYVAGMPDHKARTLANLQGREVAAVDAMLAHRKDADDVSRSEYERTLSAGLADAEEERLSHIRRDIAALL